MRHRAVVVLVGLLVAVVVNSASATYRDDILKESDDEVIYRVARGIRGKNRGPAASGADCRYKKGPWEQCNTATNTQHRTLTLKRGDASSCDQTKLLTRNCKKGTAACRYEKGEWGSCDAATNLRSRTDTLKPKSDPSCEPTRTITKQCKNMCRYERSGDWSKCDLQLGQKTKVLRLSPGSPAECPPTKPVSKTCRAGGRKGGRPRQSEEEDDEEEEE